MQPLKILIYAILLLASAFSISSCGNDGAKKEAMENIDKSGPEYTSAYVCPMHCAGSGSDKPGKCPVCSMDYVANKDLDSHDHDGHDHEGHSH